MKTIVAVDNRWGIGKNNDLLFHLPSDMKHFREVTLNKIVVMGLNTLKSLPESKPLKNRLNIVLSDEPIEPQDNLIICSSLQEVFSTLSQYSTDDIFIIGGGMMYNQLCDYCSEAIVTKVYCDGEATVFFPNLDNKDNWRLSSCDPLMTEKNLTFQYCEYINNSVKELGCEV